MNDKEWKLTKAGEEQVEYFIKECKARRKEILDAGKDTADETNIPTKEDILSDINDGSFLDEDGYRSVFGVTDNCDLCIELAYGIDIVQEQEREIMNTEMMAAICQEYENASQTLSSLTKTLAIVHMKLVQAESYTQEISLKQYKRLKEEVKELTTAVHDATIMLNVWNKAREVCMEVIDDEN